jgi:sister chromatid cohesion protein PDS5
VAHITALAQLAKMAPDAFESKSDVIMAFLLKEVLMTSSIPDPVRGLSSVIGCSPSI